MLATERYPETRRALRRLGEELSHALARIALHGVDRLGARPVVHGRPFVENLGRLEIGDDLELCAVPVRSHLVTGPHGALQIGDGVTIGAGAAIAAEEYVELDDGVHLEPGVMILDSDYHDTADRSAPGVSAPIVIGARAWIGERVTILHGTTIGEDARIEPGSVVSGTVPVGAVFAGVPARAVHHHRDGNSPADLLARVQRLCAEVFALPAPPAPSRGPKDIPGWDSLGALRLLVSLEEDLGVTLPPSALANVTDLAALAELLAKQRVSKVIE